jgi:GTP cyclohydrolase I
VTHRLLIEATCPVDGRPDRYRCWVRVDRTLPVEKIEEAVAAYTRRPVYQEALTAALAFVLDAEVVTVGHHAEGRVRTLCRCTP